MRIISEQKDYYDCVQATGQDQSLVYVRKPEEVLSKSRKWDFPLFESGYWFTPSVDTTEHIIGFCGKIYPMLELVRDQLSTKCFTIEQVDKFLKQVLKPKQFKIYQGISSGRRFYWGPTRRTKYVQFFEECRKEQNSHLEKFNEKRCPVFVAVYAKSKVVITYNGLLKPYEFVRIFDPYTAFQEIAMFMSNMAMPEKVMPTIPDEMKIFSRGFTDQSFRAPFSDPKRIPK